MERLRVAERVEKETAPAHGRGHRNLWSSRFVVFNRVIEVNHSERSTFKYKGCLHWQGAHGDSVFRSSLARSSTPPEPFDPAGIKIPRTERLRAIEHLERWKTWLLGRAVLYIFLRRSRRRRRLYIFTKMYGDRAGGCFVTVITKS